MHNSFEFATNGGKNLVFHNLGKGKFEDVTDKMRVGSTRWSLAASAADFNGDAWPDIYLATDYCPEARDLNARGRSCVLANAGRERRPKAGVAGPVGAG